MHTFLFYNKFTVHSVLHAHCNESHCDMISDTVFEKLACLLHQLATIQIKDELYIYIYIYIYMDTVGYFKT